MQAASLAGAQTALASTGGLGKAVGSLREEVSGGPPTQRLCIHIALIVHIIDGHLRRKRLSIGPGIRKRPLPSTPRHVCGEPAHLAQISQFMAIIDHVLQMQSFDFGSAETSISVFLIGLRRTTEWNDFAHASTSRQYAIRSIHPLLAARAGDGALTSSICRMNLSHLPDGIRMRSVVRSRRMTPELPAVGWLDKHVELRRPPGRRPLPPFACRPWSNDCGRNAKSAFRSRTCAPPVGEQA